MIKTTRKLRLLRETVRALSSRELAGVLGGDSTGSDGNASPGTGSCSNQTTSCACGDPGRGKPGKGVIQ